MSTNDTTGLMTLDLEYPDGWIETWTVPTGATPESLITAAEAMLSYAGRDPSVRQEDLQDMAARVLKTAGITIADSVFQDRAIPPSDAGSEAPELRDPAAIAGAGAPESATDSPKPAASARRRTKPKD